MIIAIAPGGPGSWPTWTSSAKDMVTTALGTSRVWVTLGYGILNEVYWPATGLPQIRDLGFIVAGSSEWFEVRQYEPLRSFSPASQQWRRTQQCSRRGGFDGLEGRDRTLPAERFRLFEIERRIRGSFRRMAGFFQERANDLGIRRSH